MALNDALAVLDQIEASRARNNANWMSLARIALTAAPEEAAPVLAAILDRDEEIQSLGRKLLAELGKG